MTNNADPDQTAPEGSGSALFAYAILSDTLVYKILGHLPYTDQKEDPDQTAEYKVRPEFPPVV